MSAGCLLTPGVALRAQTLSVQAVAVRPDDVLGNVQGARVVLTSRLGSTPISVRLGTSNLSGSGDTTRRVCGGFIAPDVNCPVEPARTASRLPLVLLGISGAPFLKGGVGLELSVGLVAGQARLDTRGTSTGNRLHAKKLMLGVDAGLDLHYFPSDGAIGVQVGASVAGMFPPGLSKCADCYDPIDRGFGATVWSAGLTWRFRRL
jgi:hypothetical protein